MTVHVKRAMPPSPRPVGLQQIINPRLTRRGFLAGTATLPMAADVALARVGPSMDLEFDLSGDGTTLVVREFPHPVPGQIPDSDLQWKWKVTAAAFGPNAWFDLTIDKKHENHRYLKVRNAGYGAVQGLTLEFVFRPVPPDPERMDYWTLQLTTGLWRSAAKPAAAWTSGTQRFRDFLQIGGYELSAFVNAANANLRLGQIFDHRVAADKASEALTLAFDKDCRWRLSRTRGVAATSFDGLAQAGAFTLGWYQVENQAPFLRGFAKNSEEQDDRVKVSSPFRVGGTSGSSVSISDFAASGAPLEWEARQVASSLVPNAVETFAKLTFGPAKLAIADDEDPTAEQISAGSLFITECRLPLKDQLLRRTLWGDVKKTDAPVELRTLVGRLGVNAPEQVKAPDQPAPPAKASDQPAPPPAAPAASSPPQDWDRLIASGDRAGAQEASIWAVFDQTKGANPYTARRIAVDLTLLSSDFALPDVSHSALTFGSADFRLVYEDGQPMKELSAGEFPRPPASSYLWVGPLDDGKEIAHFDLSRATLAVARDVDLVKLRFRFLDLTLVLTPHPVIRPAHADCRVIDLGKGHFRDDRPVLVAEFDPQHVFEEALFRQFIPLPDVAGPLTVVFDGHSDNNQSRNDIFNKIKEYSADPGKLADYRKAVRQAKILKEAESSGHEFKDFCDDYEKAATLAALPDDQQIYVGPFALDPDAMALARQVEQKRATAAVTDSIKNLFQRIKDFIAVDKKSKTPILGLVKPTDPHNPGPDDYYLANALRNEAVLEQQEPVYGVFREFYRNEMIREYYAKEGDAPATLDSIDREFFHEDDSPNWPPNRIPLYDPRDAREKTVVAKFIEKIVGDDPVGFSELSDARLSQPTRLAFHVNCAPAPAATAEEAGLPDNSGASPQMPHSGRFAYPDLAFTFAALTDWSRHEPAVTLRARKLFSGNASGIVPPIGARAANLADGDVLAYQGFTRGPVTAEQRLGEIRASLAKKPTPYETAIEIPARLTLSTAQDAIWFDKRKLPWQVVHERAGKVPTSAPEETTGGGTVIKPGDSVRRSHEPLWTARLALDGLEPNLRIVDSPDLRPNALTWLKPGDVRQIGQGAPPRGPLAPWFIGPEQMDAVTLRAADAYAKLPPGAQIQDPATNKPVPKDVICVPPWRDRIWRFLRILCGRDDDRDKLGTLRLFRAVLDAYDRHELVLLSSAYGLPVIGKRKPREGDPAGSEVAGGLVANSGQIEPGDEFPVLDADDAQAMQRPQQLRVRELWLSALGGSLIHDTQFLPSAGANDLWGGKIFDGFSIERWRAEVVLGRDIVGEVVYKGYLFPFGHRASLVKLTERLFLRSETLGVKAVLVQRIFIRVGRKTQPYPCVGQPFDGRLWCARNVTIQTVQTPDLQDPYELPKCDPTVDLTCNPENPVGGRIGLGGAPGLAFWPRVNETDEGLVKFNFTIDGAATSMPLIFVDNVAATNGASLRVLVETYRRWAPWVATRRTAALREQNIRYAQETKTGDCTLKTQSLLVSVHGRLNQLSTIWNGDLNAYDTTAILEGAEQPPFYPSMEKATVRLDHVERFSGGAPRPVDVQYDGRYVRFGFAPKTDDPSKQTNPLEVYLNLRSCVAMKMGNNGDRSGAVGRPESDIVALGRGNGPIGASGAVIYEKTAPLSADEHKGNMAQPPVAVSDKAILIAEPSPAAQFHDLLSLADFFDPQNDYLPKPSVPAAVAAPPARAMAAAGPDPTEAIRKVLGTFFSPDAKILGVVKIVALLKFLGFDTASLLASTPVLRETLQFGSGLVADAQHDAQVLVRDIHVHVLAPLQDVVKRLQAQWDLAGKQLKSQVSLAQVFPEIDSGLKDLAAKLATAQADEDPLGLIGDLAAVYESARAFAAALDRIASNPVARLQAAAVDAVQALLTQFLQSTTVFNETFKQLDSILTDVLGTPGKLVGWLTDLIKNSDAGELSEVLTFALVPPDIVTLANQTTTGIGTSLDDIAKTLKDELKLDVLNFVPSIIGDILAGNEAFKNVRDKIATQVNGAVTHANTAIAAQIGSAQAEAAFILAAELNGFYQSILSDPDVSASLQNVYRAATFVIDVIDKAKQLQQDIQQDISAGNIHNSLSDLAALSDMLLGVGGTALKQVDTFLKEGFKNLQNKLKIAGLTPPAPGSPDFKAEITACKTYHDWSSAQKKNKLVPKPTATATFEPMITLDALRDAMEEAQKAVQNVFDLVITNTTNNAEIINKAAAVGLNVTAQLTLIGDAQKLMNGPDADVTDLGLVGDASAFYCGFVSGLARLGAAQTLATNADWTTVNTELVTRLNRYAGACGQSAGEIGLALGSAAKRLGDFIEMHTLIAGGTLLAGALDTIAGINNLSISGQLTGFSNDWKTKQEKNVVDALIKALNALIGFLQSGGAFANEVTTELGGAFSSLDPPLAKLGVNLEPEKGKLKAALKNLSDASAAFAKLIPISAGAATTIVGLLGTPASSTGTPTVKDLFAGASPLYKDLSLALYNFEAAAFVEWRALQERAKGLPDYLQRAVVLAAQSPLQTFRGAYKGLLDLRNDAATSINSPLLSLQARRSLFVAPVYTSPPVVDVNDQTDNDQILKALEGNDRLAEEFKVLDKIAAYVPPATGPDTTIGNFVRFIDSWPSGDAAPLQIALHVKDLAAEVLKGNILALIDVAAFRDAILDAIAHLVPTKAVFSYDFASVVTNQPNDTDIFQAQVGARFVLTTRVEVDLLDQGSTAFTASGSLGPFAIKLVGSIVDAITLRFGGASFAARSGASPRFDVSYDSYEIGPALQFVQELESYLTPSDGAGFHIGPLDWALGLEVGYGVNLGSIGIGEVSFFNIIFDVSADLPFTNDGALFKTSLGTRLSPFTISILPYAGSGYFAIYSAADGIRGFEASFLFGGGGSLSFGPLEAQVQIQVGAFIRILKVGKINSTLIAGTFLAAGSMTIWIFNFAATLYVSLGEDNAGNMYGEAIFTFSFSAGIIDYSYSVTASHNQPALGSNGGGGASELEQGLQPLTRFAALRGGDVLSDAADGLMLAAAGISTPAAGKEPQDVVSNAKCQSDDWKTYASYFDFDLVQ
jgi:hypothetical protein